MQAGLAAVRYLTGDLPGAAALYGESLQQSYALAFWPLVVSSLLGLAGIAVDAGQPEVGTRLLGATESFATLLGAPLFTRDGPVYERVLAALRSGLGEDRLVAMREAGSTLGIDQAVAEAIAVAEALVQVPS
jgi:hypothetical protein